MATLTKTFSFNSNDEGWYFVQTGSGNVNYYWDVLNQSLSVGTTSTMESSGYWEWGGSWESLGVPSGTTIGSIRFYVDDKIVSYGGNVQVGPYTLRRGVNGMTTISTMIPGRSNTTEEFAYTNNGSATIAIPSEVQPSNSNIYFRSNVLLPGNLTGEYTPQVYLDNVVIEINYSLPPEIFSGTASLPLKVKLSGTGEVINIFSGTSSLPLKVKLSGTATYQPPAIESGSTNLSLLARLTGYGEWDMPDYSGQGLFVHSIGLSGDGPGNIDSVSTEQAMGIGARLGGEGYIISPGSASIDLFIKGPGPAEADITLFALGPEGSIKDLNLFLKTLDVPTLSSNLELWLEGDLTSSANSIIRDTLDLYLVGGGFSNILNLFVKVSDVGGLNSNLNLFVYSEPIRFASLDLFVYNTSGEASRNLSLYLRGPFGRPGYLLAESTMNLFLEGGERIGDFYEPVPLQSSIDLHSVGGLAGEVIYVPNVYNVMTLFINGDGGSIFNSTTLFTVGKRPGAEGSLDLIIPHVSLIQSLPLIITGF